MKNQPQDTAAEPVLQTPMYFIYGTTGTGKAAKREKYLHAWVGDNHDPLGRTKAVQREYVCRKLEACMLLWEHVTFTLIQRDEYGNETDLTA